MRYRENLIKIVTFLGGIYFFLEFVLPAKIGDFQFDKYTDQIANGLAAMGVMAVGLGVISIITVHGARVAFLRKGYTTSIALIIGMLAMAFATGLDWYYLNKNSKRVAEISLLENFALAIKKDFEEGKKDVPALEVRNQKLTQSVSALLGNFENQREQALIDNFPESDAKFVLMKQAREKLNQLKSEATELNTRMASNLTDTNLDQELGTKLHALAVTKRDLLGIIHRQAFSKLFYNFLFNGFFISLGSAMFALLGFYIASAAYRAFRIRSAESALMMTAALLVMLGQIPFGSWIWDGMADVRLWLMQIPNAAASRAIKLGASVAGLVIAFRMWFSIESENFSKR